LETYRKNALITLMVCQNCGSNEVIAVQGENFCINCGQLVPKVPVASAVSTVGLPAGVKILPLHQSKSTTRSLRKPKLGRPKAGRLDVAAPATKQIIGQPDNGSPTDFSDRASEDTVPLSPSPIQDITPPPMKAVDRPLPEILGRISVSYSQILGRSITGRYTNRRGLFALVPASLLAIIGTVVGLVLASAHPEKLVFVTRSVGWGVYGELGIISILYYLIRSLSHAAIIFGSARLSDHRPLPPERWLETAADSQDRRTRLDLLGALGLFTIAGLIAGLAYVGGTPWSTPEYVQVIVLMVGYLTLLYSLLALIMAVSLGHVAVTLARVQVFSGLTLGWRLFKHHFELAGARLTALILEFLALGVVAVGAGGWFIITPVGERPILIISLGFIAAVIGAFAGAGTAIWWGNAYRMLVQVDHPAGFHRLLSTSAPKPARRLPVVVISIFILFMTVIAALWPWFIA
jgi:hypothetical protein